MDVYIYETAAGDYLRLRGLTDRLSGFSLERTACAGDKLEAEFISDGELFKPGRIIEIPDVFSGLITGLKEVQGSGRTEISALSFSGLISRRVLSEYERNDSILTLIEKNCGPNARAERVFPDTFIDKSADCAFSVTRSYIRKSISRAVLAAHEKGFRVCSEIVHDDIGARIRIYGKYSSDFSISSGNALPVILSERYDTLGGRSYSYSDKGTVNGAYIYSNEKYNSKGEIGCEAWSGYYGEASGFQRCEEAYEIEPVIYYSCSIVDGEMVFSTALDIAGTREAAEDLFVSRYAPPSEVISAALGNGMASAVRSGAFGVGDKVTLYPDESGVNSVRRIMKITERYENGGLTMAIFLGREF